MKKNFVSDSYQNCVNLSVPCVNPCVLCGKILTVQKSLKRKERNEHAKSAMKEGTLIIPCGKKP